jgi:hypothetical protein
VSGQTIGGTTLFDISGFIGTSRSSVRIIPHLRQ